MDGDRGAHDLSAEHAAGPRQVRPYEVERRTRVFRPLGPARCYCPRLAALAKRRASSAARNSAFALLTHSCCSNAGSESATMPAPACTYITPSFTNAVRSTMQVSISPLAEK